MIRYIKDVQENDSRRDEPGQREFTLQVLTAMNHHTCCLHVSQQSDSVVVDLLFSVAPIVCGGSVFGP